MDTTTKEREAVLAISIKANRSNPALQAEIPMGDRGISLDGEILVFNDEERTKKSYQTSCRVQVKGTEATPLSQNNIKRDVELEDLRNYKDYKAVIYFVVEIDKNFNHKIFYHLLTLKEIDNLIKKHGKQITVRIDFFPLGEEQNALYKLCQKCIYHQQTQLKLPDNRKYDITKTTLLTPNLDLTYENMGELFNHDAIIIGETRDGFTIPLDLVRITELSFSDELKLAVNDKIFYLSATVKNKKDSNITEIELENTITLYIDPHKQIIQFKNHVFNNLASQLKVFPFFLEIARGGMFNMNDEPIANIKADQSAEQRVKYRIERLEKLKESFHRANINDSIEIGETENIENEINIFIDIILNEKYHLLSLPENMEDNGFIIAPYRLGKAHFLMCYVTETLSEASENLPRFFSIYSPHMDRFQALVTVPDEERTLDISIYVPITLYNLLRSDDVDSSIVIKTLDHSEVFHSFELQHDVNEFGLNCLRVYDEKEDPEWLYIAAHIFSKLSDDVSKINHVQTLKRLEGQIDEEQKKILIDMKVKLPSDDTLDQLKKRQMLFCIVVLLDSIEEANAFYNSFSEEEKSTLQEWPIYKLYKSYILLNGG